MDSDKIETDEIVCAGSNDAGDLFKVECPSCAQEITLTNGGGWWDTTCSCGYHWTLELKAVGYKDD